MGRHQIDHPPNPTGATSRELGVVQRLHRAGTTTEDQASRPAILEGVALLVELIESRNRRQSLTDQWDHNQAEGWAE